MGEISLTESEVLMALEKLLGMTAKETADVLGVSYSTYMKWRIGSRKIPAVGLRCIKYVKQLTRSGVDFTDN